MKQIIGEVCLYRRVIKSLSHKGSEISSTFEYCGIDWNLSVARTLVALDSKGAEIKLASGGIRVWLSRSGEFEEEVGPRDPIQVCFEISIVTQSKAPKRLIIGSYTHVFGIGSRGPSSYVSFDIVNDPINNFNKNSSIVLQVRISKDELEEPIDEQSWHNPQMNTPKLAELFEPKFDYVYFDVGGYFHMCHSSTLLKFSDSMLAKFIKPEFDTRKDQSEFIRIDRDGAQMGLIINYMRDPVNFTLAHLPADQIKSLKMEADFYSLTSLVDICNSHIRENDAWRRTALAVIDKVAMIENLLRSTKPAIVLASSIKSDIMRQMIFYCDESKFNVFCYYGSDWFDGKFSVYLFDPAIQVCYNRVQSDDELTLLKFILDANNYVPV